jgi:hypothetical protein
MPSRRWFVFRLHILEQLKGFAEVRLEVLPHQVEHLAEDWVAQRVEHLVAVLAADDDLPGAQHREVLGHVGLLQTEPLVQPAVRAS